MKVYFSCSVCGRSPCVVGVYFSTNENNFQFPEERSRCSDAVGPPFLRNFSFFLAIGRRSHLAAALPRKMATGDVFRAFFFIDDRLVFLFVCLFTHPRVGSAVCVTCVGVFVIGTGARNKEEKRGNAGRPEAIQDGGRWSSAQFGKVGRPQLSSVFFYLSSPLSSSHSPSSPPPPPLRLSFFSFFFGRFFPCLFL